MKGEKEYPDEGKNREAPSRREIVVVTLVILIFGLVAWSSIHVAQEASRASRAEVDLEIVSGLLKYHAKQNDDNFPEGESFEDLTETLSLGFEEFPREAPKDWKYTASVQQKEFLLRAENLKNGDTIECIVDICPK